VSYKVIIKPSAEKQFSSLSQGQKKAILSKLKELRQNPRPPGAIRLRNHETLWRVKHRNVRAIYDEPDENNVIYVLRIGVDHSIYADLDKLIH